MRAGCARLLACAILSGCGQEPAPVAPAASAPTTQLANPASTNCVKVGGRLVIEKNPAGAEFGVCLFEDNHQCEEWALLRGECPVGGRRITGYATRAGRYCAITGGQYTVTSGSDASDEKGSCTLPNGKVCDADAYYDGTCVR
jgi:putative hemolysin